MAHFRYVLEQGTKEGLVASPLDWPGVNPARTFAAGRMTMRGEWVDRTAMRKAREKGRDVREADYTFPETLELTPISCLAHLSEEEYLRAPA